MECMLYSREGGGGGTIRAEGERQEGGERGSEGELGREGGSEVKGPGGKKGRGKREGGKKRGGRAAARRRKGGWVSAFAYPCALIITTT
jgi:hypothetical protein